MVTLRRNLRFQTLWIGQSAVSLGVSVANVAYPLVILAILHHQNVPSAQIGLALGLGAAGGLAGAPLVKVLHRLRPGVLLLGVCTLWVPLFALIAVPLGPWWVALLLFAAMLGAPAIRVAIDILVIRRAPAEVRGRVVAALMTLVGLGVPAGIAGCGLLLQYLPAQAAMLVLAGILLAAVGAAARQEVWRAQWPR